MTKMTGGILSCALGLWSGTAIADTYIVNGDGSADFLTITAAVVAAQDGDVILVHAGLYEEGPISLLGKRVVINGVLGGVDSVKERPSSWPQNTNTHNRAGPNSMPLRWPMWQLKAAAAAASY